LEKKAVVAGVGRDA